MEEPARQQLLFGLLLGTLITACLWLLIFAVIVAYTIPNTRNEGNGYPVYRTESLVKALLYQLKPFTVSGECIANANVLCCEGPKSTGSAYSNGCSTTLQRRADQFCDVYHRTCRRQADGKCGWDPQEVKRVQTCVEQGEYPPIAEALVGS